VVQRGGESRALAEAREFRAGVMQGDAQMLRTLQQAYRPVMRRLTQQIDDLTRLIAERARAGAVTTPGSIVRLAEYREMAAGLERALDAYGVRTTGVITSRQRTLIVDAIEHSRTLAGSQLPRGVNFDTLTSLGYAWAAVDADALEVLVGAMRDGSTLNTYLRTQLVRGTMGRLTSTLEAGMLENPRVTAAHMKTQLAGGMVQALRVARSETLRAYREAERAQYEANDDLVRGYRRIATLDDRTCAACYLMDGVLYPNDRDLDEHVQGRCFTVPELVPLSALGIRGVQAEPLVRAEDTGRARFLRADESEQRRIVGNDRLYGLWANGRIPLNGLVGWTRDPVWGDSLGVNSAVRALDGFFAPRIPAHDTYWRPRA